MIITIVLLTQKDVYFIYTHSCKPTFATSVVRHLDIAWHRVRAIPIIRDVIWFQKCCTFHSNGSIPGSSFKCVSPTSDFHWVSYCRTNMLLPRKFAWEVCVESCMTCNSQLEAGSTLSLAIVNSWAPKTNRTWKYFDWNSIWRIGSFYFSRLLWENTGTYYVSMFKIRQKKLRFTKQEIIVGR